ncbi:MAG: hypothetical protein ACOY3P_20235 [Planctomycetota bacterium]
MSDNRTIHVCDIPTAHVESCRVSGMRKALIRVEVHYSKGGVSFFDGSRTRSGINLSIKEVLLDDAGFESFILGRGLRCTLEEANRFNRKRLEHYAACVRDLPVYARVMDMFLAKYPHLAQKEESPCV